MSKHRNSRDSRSKIPSRAASTKKPRHSRAPKSFGHEESGAQAELQAGRICVHPAGYGFVTRDDGADDVFIAARHRGAALDGDRVLITTFAGWKGTEGRVVQVLEHGRAKISGVVRRTGRAIYLEPDDPRILGRVGLDLSGALIGPGSTSSPGHPSAALSTLREGIAVVAEIVRYPHEPDAPLVARVLQVLGDPDDPRTEVAKIIACGEIPDVFPDEVREAAERVPQQVSALDLCDRVDLRDREFLTIDPETARDFDDAVCIEDGPRAGIERLWVAVADVSHYVRPRTALDLEASIRGVSVYLPDRAIPMLPHELSSGICSLNPDVDRLAMVARLDVDESGRVIAAEFLAAVIRSRARLDYAGVAAALGGDLRGPRARYREYLPHLKRMQALAARLRAVRIERGALDFDLPEAIVLLDEEDPKKVRDVKRARALPDVRAAYKLVEDFMLAANEAVASFFISRKLHTLWRVHAPPTLARLEEFAALATSFGIPLELEKLRTPKNLRDFIAQIAGHPAEQALSFLLLRSLKQASYELENLGHFGLAASEYLHFTSPIRRYPDLIVHRLLKYQLRREGLPSGGSTTEPLPPREELVRQAAACSSYERRAMEAEREVVDMYRAFLMRDHIGEDFDGTVTGVAAFGLFIEVAEPFVEGLIKVEKLGEERFHFDAKTLRLSGEQSGRTFSLGEKIRVRVENVSVPRRHIELGLLLHPEQASEKKSTRKRRVRSQASA